MPLHKNHKNVFNSLFYRREKNKCFDTVLCAGLNQAFVLEECDLCLRVPKKKEKKKGEEVNLR